VGGLQCEKTLKICQQQRNVRPSSVLPIPLEPLNAKELQIFSKMWRQSTSLVSLL
jgi:hypothetical protein